MTRLVDNLRGLTVRWSLSGAPADTLQRLEEYVRDTSHDRFSAMDGLCFKTWRARTGEWFEGCYVFATRADREAFQTSFTATADSSPGSQIIGWGPELIEPCEVVAIAEGAGGFSAAPSYDHT